jgi:hypothetical protein
MSIFRSALEVLKAIGRFLDSPEVPTKKSERINDIMLGILLVLILVAVFIGNMLLVTGPAAFPVG